MALVHDPEEATTVTIYGTDVSEVVTGNDSTKGGEEVLRVLLIDPSPLSRSCLVAGFGENKNISITACQHSKELAHARFDDGPPDVIILQAAGQDLESAEFGAQLQSVIRAFPTTGIMLLSGSEHVDQMLAAFEQGVGAYITGNLGLIPTIRAMQLMREGMIVYPLEILTDLRKYIKPATPPEIHEHEAGIHEDILTPRQRDVLLLLAQGLSNKAIAGKLTISESTVKVHIRAIMERTGMLNRTQIVAHFFRDR